MNCSCNATSIDGDGYYYSRIRKAAKPTVCPECNKVIEKGEEYLFTTLFFEGRIHNDKMCKICESIVSQFFRNGHRCGHIKRRS